MAKLFGKIKRFVKVGRRVSALEKKVAALEKTVAALEAKNKKLTRKTKETVTEDVNEIGRLDKTKKREEFTTELPCDISYEKFINKKYDELTDIERKIYCEDICEIDNKNITLRGVCAGLGIPVPEKYEAIADEKQTLAFRSKQVKPGDICMIIRSAEDFKKRKLTSKGQYELAIKNGAKMVIMGRDEFNQYDLNEDDFPVILTDHHNERILRFFSLLRRQETAKVVMLTGSVGKTTTKDLCHTVAKNRFNTYAHTRNSNTAHQTAKHLFYHSNKGREVYIQECGAGYQGSVRFAASMLRPDIFILTNVYKHHLQIYKTFDCLFNDKTSPDDCLTDNGVIITNYDDENIRNHPFKHRVVSFAINHEDVDFRAINIKQIQDNLSFDVYEKATGKTTNVSLQLLGEHNVYNALAAFAFGKELGLTEEQITEDLQEYRPEGIRQYFTNIGGVYINMDCYNVAEESIIAMLSAGEKIELKEGAKKYALIGGENKLGEDVVERSEKFGPELAKIKMDKYLFCGTENRSKKSLNHYGDAESMQKGFKKVSKIPNQLSLSIEDMIEFLKENVKRDDLVMFKGIYYLDMPIAADKVFGTSFCFDQSHYEDARVTITGDDCKAYLVPKFGELEIISAPINEGVLTIPDAIEGYPTFRIMNNTFEGKARILSVDFGTVIKNIGKGAFRNCKRICELTIPGNVLVIEERVFENCTALKRVVIEPGTTHIGMRAFAGCTELEEIIIPQTVGKIEENAFRKCGKVQIICAEGSAAHEYAVENNIEFKLQTV